MEAPVMYLVSRTHSSLARTDLAFGNTPFLALVQDTTYLAGGYLTITRCQLPLHSPKIPGKGVWKLKTSWLQTDQVSSHLQAAIKSYWATNADSAEPLGVLGAFKQS